MQRTIANTGQILTMFTLKHHQQEQITRLTRLTEYKERW